MKKVIKTSIVELSCAVIRCMRNKMTPADYELLRNVYLKLPIPVIGKKYIKQGFYLACRLQRFLAGQNAVDRFDRPFILPSFKPAPQAQDKADYYIFGVIDWNHLYQRPQHLSRRFAALGHRVFFISPQLRHADHKGFSLECLDEAERLFSISINAYLPCNIHYRKPDPRTVSELLLSMGELLCWTGSAQRVWLVEHPTWYELISQLPGGVVVYDCMDHHEGFRDEVDVTLQNMESALLAYADLTVVTSQWLADAVTTRARKTVVIRNAGEFKHFSSCTSEECLAPKKTPVIGYYGMIAEWFDVPLLKTLAATCSHCRIVLVGNDVINAKSRLSQHTNVMFTGKIPYAALPAYLHAFDICLLPFLPIPLIQATNPVKIYEYLSAGKPVVSIDIPEMQQFDGIVYTAHNHTEFIAHVHRLLKHGEDACLVARRQKFATGQTWETRALTMTQEIASHPCLYRLSIIVVTYNNLTLTKRCLESLQINTTCTNLEIIVVDNASTDPTPDFLKAWQKNTKNRHIILNTTNKGFAAANNQGLGISSGDYLVLLNNDTCVTHGWDVTLMRHLEKDSSLGLICPVTNNIGNEAKIDISYSSMVEMQHKSLQYTSRHAGKLYPLKTVAFFCVMFSRNVLNKIGFISEEFGKGWFEDDDYCRRAEQEGYNMACAEDAFVHHELSASFNALPSQEKIDLFNKNRAIYESKWGYWIQHKARPEL